MPITNPSCLATSEKADRPSEHWPPPARPMLVQVGRLAGSAAGWRRRLNRFAQVVEFPTLLEACQAEIPSPPRATLILQHHADDGSGSPADQLAWQQRFPLTRCLVLTGPWVSRHTWPQTRWGGALCVPWYATETLLGWLKAYLQGHPVADDLPTASAEMDHLRSLRMSPQTDDPRQASPCAVVRSASLPIQQSLEQSLAAWGFLTLSRTPSPRDTTVALGLFHRTHHVDWRSDPIWNRCHTRVALIDFPRPEDLRHSLDEGYHSISALPWLRWEVAMRAATPEAIPDAATNSPERDVPESISPAGETNEP